MIRQITLYADGKALFESDFGTVSLTWGSFEHDGKLNYQFVYPSDDLDDPILRAILTDFQLMSPQDFESILNNLTIH